MDNAAGIGKTQGDPASNREGMGQETKDSGRMIGEESGRLWTLPGIEDIDDRIESGRLRTLSTKVSVIPHSIHSFIVSAFPVTICEYHRTKTIRRNDHCLNMYIFVRV